MACLPSPIMARFACKTHFPYEASHPQNTSQNISVQTLICTGVKPERNRESDQPSRRKVPTRFAQLWAYQRPKTITRALSGMCIHMTGGLTISNRANVLTLQGTDGLYG